MPRFVLLYHDCPASYERPSHWDLMVEANGALRTWALPRLPRDWEAYAMRTRDLCDDSPPVAGDNSVACEQLADHRLEYLSKEGPVGGGRGRVHRIEAGVYTSEVEGAGFWQVTLLGESWAGRVTLQQIAAESRQWSVTVDTPR